MARVLCIQPCLPPVEMKFRFPGIPLPDGITSKQSLNLNMTCSGCDLVASFLFQIQPILLSLQFPLCIINCILSITNPSNPSDDTTVVGSILSVFTSLTSPDQLPPDVTKIVSSLDTVVLNCLPCVLAFDPRVIACAVADLGRLFISILSCVEGLLTHLMSLSLQVAGLMGSPDITLRTTGDCLERLLGVQKETVIAKFNAIAEIFKLMNYLLRVAGLRCVPTGLTLTPTSSFDVILAEIAAIKTRIQDTIVAPAEIICTAVIPIGDPIPDCT